MILSAKDKRTVTAGLIIILSASAILTADEELRELRDAIARRSLRDELGADGTSTAIELIRTGIVVGILYVFTGPNLAALVTLSGTDVIDNYDYDEDVKRKRRDGTFVLGIRWGIGNAVGLLLVGGLLISVRSMASTAWTEANYVVGSILHACVGVFSLLLGAYGVVKAMKNREYRSNEADLQFVPRPERFTHRDSESSAGMESAVTEAVANLVAMKANAKLSHRDSETSAGMESAVTEVATNIRALQRNGKSDDESVQSQGSRDSIVGEMVACLKADKESSDDEELGKHFELTDFERRMLHSAKTLSESMHEANDLFSSFTSTISDDQSLRTIQLTREESLKTIPLNDTKTVDDIVRTKDEDTQVSTAGKLKRKKRFKMPKFPRRQRKIKFTYLCKNSSFGKCFACTPGILAVFAGIIRGIASPGEVLSNVQLQRAPMLMILYLASFCATSTLVMGGFAALYGKLCKFLTGNLYEKDEDAVLSRAFMVEFGSACLSVVVGIVWLTLLAVGQLDMMFLVDILYDSSILVSE